VSTLNLPYPPTANNLFDNVPRRGRVKSAGYRAWLTEAGWLIKMQKPEPVRGSYRLTIIATRPDRRARDLGNLEKAVSDLLKAAGVIEDDSLARSIFLVWDDMPPVKGGAITVHLHPDLSDPSNLGAAA
jgi:crossover junction endodeoxyribonuclease RusA